MYIIILSFGKRQKNKILVCKLFLIKALILLYIQRTLNVITCTQFLLCFKEQVKLIKAFKLFSVKAATVFKNKTLNSYLNATVQALIKQTEVKTKFQLYE